MDSASFIEAARKVHGDTYDYSRVRYTNARSKVEIGLPDGTFIWQTAYRHLQGYSPRPPKRTTEDFIREAQAVHGDKFDYSRTVYEKTTGKVWIGLPDGSFVEQCAKAHLRGHIPSTLRGTRIASSIYHSSARASSRAAFNSYAEAHLAPLYDASEMAFVDWSTPVVLGCRLHGRFTALPRSLMRGSRCPHCSAAKRGERRSAPFAESFETRARIVHGDTYSYGAYAANNRKMEITCPEHGVFLQNPHKHLSGNGCPKCGVLMGGKQSKPQQEIYAWLLSLPLPDGTDCTYEHSIGGNHHVDIRIGLLAVEYHGLFWHSTGSVGFLKKPQWNLTRWSRRHLVKRLECERQGLRYIAIYEDEWRDRRGLVERYLKAQLGLAPRIGARKLSVCEVESSEARAFLAEHHWLGAGAARVYLGLRDRDGALRAVMSGGPAKEHRGRGESAGVWSLARYCTDGCVIPGGAKRLFDRLTACALADGAVEMVSYVDCDKYQGGLYEALGFDFDGDIAPDYWTLWNCSPNTIRRHKTATKRCALRRLPGFREEETEFENCQRMKIWRIYHSGRKRYRKCLIC